MDLQVAQHPTLCYAFEGWAGFMCLIFTESSRRLGPSCQQPFAHLSSHQSDCFICHSYPPPHVKCPSSTCANSFAMTPLSARCRLGSYRAAEGVLIQRYRFCSRKSAVLQAGRGWRRGVKEGPGRGW